MKLKCPKDPNHKRFIGTATVTEDWIVDENGDFREIWKYNSGQTISGPDSFLCEECMVEVLAGDIDAGVQAEESRVERGQARWSETGKAK